MNTSILNDDPAVAMDTAQLTVAARKAHEQKRTKECLGLINKLLLCDPGNSEAKALRASVLSDVEQDLSDARILLADSESRQDGHKYRKAAEIVLLKVLYIDPTHTEAKALLAKARASANPVHPAPVLVEAPRPKPSMIEELQFTAQTTRVEKKHSNNSGITRKIPVVLAGFILLAGGGLFLSRTHAERSAAAVESVNTADAANPEPLHVRDNAMVQDASSSTALLPTEPQLALASAIPTLAPVVAAPGLLAVTSPTPSEVYVGGKQVGETPMTLQLPAGVQTVEFRHGDLRTTLTQEIKSRETTNAVVNFDVIVQINARPWAQVFVDGTARKPLGQTPLSSVRVPVGSILAFENPNFPTKSYQVTDKDSSIQVVFP